MWSFFDMEPPSERTLDQQHPVMQTLKAKLNRQRLLFHPDKNCHPEAEKTFKFLEQCYQKLFAAFAVRNNETIHQRTRREEEELKKEQALRKEQEEARRVQEERIHREEEDRLRRAEEAHERLQTMRRAKEAEAAALAASRGGPSRHNERPVQPGVPSIFASTCMPASLDDLNIEGVEEIRSLEAPALPERPLGSLRVKLLSGKDLPPANMFGWGTFFATASVGCQRFHSSRLPGNHPVWESSFQFDVFRVDTSLCIQVYREGWFEDTPLGKVEIPFLDLEEWSGCPIGRVLQPQDPELTSSGQLMLVELRASFEWF